MFAGKEPCGTARFVIEDQIDLALPPQVDVFRAMRCHMGEAHRLEDRFDHALFGSAEFDEFEAVEADGIFKEIGHGSPQDFAIGFNGN